MLPDYPKLKKKISKKLLIPYLKASESGYMGVLSQISIKPIYEGNRSILIREDGTVDKMKPKKIKSGEITINLSEIESMTPDDIFNKLNKASEELARMKFHMIIDKVSQSAQNVGNVVKIKGLLTIEDFLKMLDKVWLDFDQNGMPIFPEFLAGEKVFESISKELTKLETDPYIKNRFAEIIERKREEWRARESNRELVG